MNGYQLPLYEPCGVCSALVAFNSTRRHRACDEALDRWIRPDNVGYLTELLQKGQAR